MSADVSIELSDGFIVEHFEGDEDAVLRLLLERGLAPACEPPRRDGAGSDVRPAAEPRPGPGS